MPPNMIRTNAALRADATVAATRQVRRATGNPRALPDKRLKDAWYLALRAGLVTTEDDDR